MTLSEFKAWFEGFSEGIDKAPTEKQFAKIKAKVALIDGAPVTYPVFIDRLWPRWHEPYYQHQPFWSGTIGPVTAAAGTVWMNSAASDAGNAPGPSYAYIEPASKGDNQTIPFDFDSHSAMRDLGKMEALN